MNRETKRAMARQQRTATEQGERLAEFRREQAIRQREMVVWPTRRTVAGYTVVVLVSVSVITAIIFGLDWLFGKAVLQLFT